MKTKLILNNIIIAFTIFLFSSCKKYLDAKPDDKIASVATLEDAQLLLNNYGLLNFSYPTFLEIQADNYYLNDADYNSRNDLMKSGYTWQKYDVNSTDWQPAYNAILYCNTVIDAYEQIMKGQSESAQSRNVLGSGLFFRAYYFYALAELYAPIYDPASASSDLGIVLRQDPDFTTKIKRATLKDTYNLILKDLIKAVKLLPLTPAVKSNPSKPAAYGALAKVYLSMRDYANAGLYADSCLQLYNELIDFNTLNKTSQAPFARFNKEVIFHIRSSALGSSSISPTRAKIDKDLYESYQSKDLRKVIYFRANTGVNAGTFNFKGNYDGQAVVGTSGFVFGGIVTDEMYLIRSEAYARAGNTLLAMKDLNTLLKTRWEGTYTPVTAIDAQDALKIILKERRKELLYRGTRWMDLRRLSKEPEHAVTPKRIIAGNTFELKPGSLRYVLAIPQDEIRLSGIQQNP